MSARAALIDADTSATRHPVRARPDCPHRRPCRYNDCMWLLPSRSQWAKWSLPSKLTAIGAYVGIAGAILSVVLFAASVYMQNAGAVPPLPAPDQSSTASGRGSASTQDAAHLLSAQSAPRYPDTTETQNSSVSRQNVNTGEFEHKRVTHREPQHSFEFLRNNPVWNLPTDTPLIRFSTTASPPGCDSCWSPVITLEPGQNVYAAVRYGNYGGVTARDAWLKLRIPRDFRHGPAMTAMLGASNAHTVYGAACINARRGPFALVPDAAAWYAYGSDKPLPLPFKQSADTILEDDHLRLGDVTAGAGFASDLVFRFHAVPITFVAIHFTKAWESSVGDNAFEAFTGEIDLETAVKTFFATIASRLCRVNSISETTSRRAGGCHRLSMPARVTVCWCMFSAPILSTRRFTQPRYIWFPNVTSTSKHCASISSVEKQLTLSHEPNWRQAADWRSSGRFALAILTEKRSPTSPQLKSHLPISLGC